MKGEDNELQYEARQKHLLNLLVYCHSNVMRFTSKRLKNTTEF